MFGLVFINHDDLPVNFALIDETEASHDLCSVDAAELLFGLAEIADIDWIVISINNSRYTYNPSESLTMFCYQVWGMNP